jgi:hypothetical protein
LRVEARNENTLTITRDDKGYLAIPNPTIPTDTLLNCVPKLRDTRAAVDKLWKELTDALGEDGGQIVLRTSEAKIGKATDTDLAVAELKPTGTVVFTRSAIGALNLAQDGRSVRFMTHADADILRQDNKDAPCFNSQFYLLRGENAEKRVLSSGDRWGEFNRFAFSDSLVQSRHDARDVGRNTVLIIVESSPDIPESAYVSVYKDGMWYSIDDHDDVSKANFSLLNTILTIQAVPQASTPTATTINARPGG